MAVERKNWSKFDGEDERRWVSEDAAFYEGDGTRLGRSLMMKMREGGYRKSCLL